jgi:hypothetical protein
MDAEASRRLISHVEARLHINPLTTVSTRIISYTLGGSGGPPNISGALRFSSSPTPALLPVFSIPPSSPGLLGSEPEPILADLGSPSESCVSPVSCVPLRSHSRSRCSFLSWDLVGVSWPGAVSGFLREKTDPARSRIREIPNGVDIELLRSFFETGDRTGRNRLDRWPWAERSDRRDCISCIWKSVSLRKKRADKLTATPPSSMLKSNPRDGSRARPP